MRAEVDGFALVAAPTGLDLVGVRLARTLREETADWGFRADRTCEPRPATLGLAPALARIDCLEARTTVRFKTLVRVPREVTPRFLDAGFVAFTRDDLGAARRVVLLDFLETLARLAFLAADFAVTGAFRAGLAFRLERAFLSTFALPLASERRAPLTLAITRAAADGLLADFRAAGLATAFVAEARFTGALFVVTLADLRAGLGGVRRRPALADDPPFDGDFTALRGVGDDFARDGALPFFAFGTSTPRRVARAQSLTRQ